MNPIEDIINGFILVIEVIISGFYRQKGLFQDLYRQIGVKMTSFWTVLANLDQFEAIFVISTYLVWFHPLKMGNKLVCVSHICS